VLFKFQSKNENILTRNEMEVFSS